MNNTTVCLYPGREGCKLKGQAEEVIQIRALQVEDVTERITLHLPFFLGTTPSPVYTFGTPPSIDTSPHQLGCGSPSQSCQQPRLLAPWRGREWSTVWCEWVTTTPADCFPVRGCGDDACLKILQSSGRTTGGRELADDALVLDQCQCSILSSLDPGGHTHIPGLQPAEGSHRPGAYASLASRNRGGGERG